MAAGAVLCHPDFPVPLVSRVEARIVVLDVPTPVLAGQQVPPPLSRNKITHTLPSNPPLASLLAESETLCMGNAESSALHFDANGMKVLEFQIIAPHSTRRNPHQTR